MYFVYVYKYMPVRLLVFYFFLLKKKKIFWVDGVDIDLNKKMGLYHGPIPKIFLFLFSCK